MTHWFTCNDTSKRPGREQGSILRAGRAFLYLGDGANFELGWSWWNNLRWIEARLGFSLEDGLTFALILPRVLHTYLSIPLPRRWLTGWMLEDRVFSLKFFYVGRIAELMIAHANWAEDCGMTSYYRREKPRRYSDAQLWPGWRLALRWPPVLDWLLSGAKRTKTVIDSQPVEIEMDGRRIAATWTLDRWESRRARWPWAYRIDVGSWLEVSRPPQFAGKGESAWDCGDDGIYGMGSSETTPAGAIGDYVKAVLKKRDRYLLSRHSA